MTAAARGLFDEKKWEYSLFVDAITWADLGFEMPPKTKMREDVIDVLKKWVQMGAPDPRGRETSFVKSEIDIAPPQTRPDRRPDKNP